MSSTPAFLKFSRPSRSARGRCRGCGACAGLAQGEDQSPDSPVDVPSSTTRLAPRARELTQEPAVALRDVGVPLAAARAASRVSRSASLRRPSAETASPGRCHSRRLAPPPLSLPPNPLGPRPPSRPQLVAVSLPSLLASRSPELRGRGVDLGGDSTPSRSVSNAWTNGFAVAWGVVPEVPGGPPGRGGWPPRGRPETW